jgi:hypothetical protein
MTSALSCISLTPRVQLHRRAQTERAGLGPGLSRKVPGQGHRPEEAGAGLCGLPLHSCGGAQGVEGAAAGATARAGGVGAVGQELIVAGIGHVSVNAAGARRSAMRLDSPLAQGCKRMPNLPGLRPMSTQVSSRLSEPARPGGRCRRPGHVRCDLAVCPVVLVLGCLQSSVNGGWRR